MDYKEKYEKALDVAKIWYCNPSIPSNVKRIFCRMFTELKESEDERIRKSIIADIKSRLKSCTHTLDDYYKEQLAWLEKQGEKKIDIDSSNLRTWKYIVDAVLTANGGIGQYLDSSATEEIAKKLQERFGNIEQKPIMAMSPEDCEQFIKNIIDNEEKSSDKVEPKFKIKDWIVSSENKVLQVTGIEGDSYIFNNGYGNCYYWTIQDCDKECHPWSFKDAKEGDIITCKCGWTCIFKALINDETFSSYCFMDETGYVCETGSEEYHTLRRDCIRTYNGKFYPATRMQAASFHDEMAKAGYTWNSKKKRLIER